MTRWTSLLLVLAAACGGKSTRTVDSSDGGNSTVGENGNMVLGACGAFSACGGDVVGTWAVSSLCNNGSRGKTGGLGPECAVFEGSPTFQSDSVYTFDSHGTYDMSGAIDFSFTESFDEACTNSTFGQSASGACAQLNAESALVGQTGFSGKCTFSNATCTCRVSAMRPANETGTYTAEGASLTLTPSSTATTTSLLAGTSSFCTDGTSLTVQGSDGISATLTR